MKRTITILVLILVIGLGVYAFSSNDNSGGLMSADIMSENGDSMNESMMDDGSMEEGQEMIDDGSMMEEDESMMVEKDGMMVSSGSFENYSPEKLSRAEEGDVVLYFNATWCPTCNNLNKDINSNLDNIPSDLSILKIDYDNSSELKRKYGITYQHTFVQVDSQGNQIAKWSGSPTLQALLTQVK